MKNWKDIQDEIRSSEEPLSPSAWEHMSALLDRKTRRSRWGFWTALLLLAVLSIPLILFLSGEDRNYYQPRSFTGNEAPVSQAKDDNGKASTSTSSGPSRPTLIPVAEPPKEHLPAPPEGTGSLSSVPTHTNRSSLSINTQKAAADPALPGFVIKPLKLARKDLPALESTLTAGGDRKLTAETIAVPADRKQKTGFELRFFIASTYNSASIDYKSPPLQTHRSFERATNNAVQAGWGFDAGFELRYRLGRNLMISSGVSFREIETRNNYDFEVSEIPVIDSASGTIVAYIALNESQKVQHKGSNLYNFINLPVSLYFEKALNQKWSVTAEAIHHTSILLSQSSFQLDPGTLEGRATDRDELRNTINGYQFRLGLRYRLRSNFYLALEPSYRSYYQDFFMNPNTSWKPRDLSLSLSGTVQLY